MLDDFDKWKEKDPKLRKRGAPGQFLWAFPGQYVDRKHAAQHSFVTSDARIVQGLSADDPGPFCVRPPQPRLDWVDQALLEYGISGQALPYCPEDWFDNGRLRPEFRLSDAKRRQWIARGAANAGFIVYAYLKAMLAGETPLAPDHDRCPVPNTAQP